MPAAPCLHPDFYAEVAVGRMEDAIAGKVEGTGYIADIKVRCRVCGVQFRFVGLTAGIDMLRPTVSITGETLHAPIEPADVPSLHARATFRVPGKITPQ